MTPQEAKDFIALRTKLGRNAVRALEEQGSWDGIERVVTAELYPDKSHFLFELLQNAEDAGASVVHFSLLPDQLSARHDGKRLFTKQDVEAITSIGRSPKRDDVNQIGKFGIGFKSVFAYTLSPRISSGLFHFEIRDLICPEWFAPQEKRNTKFTYFHLPFNRPTKPGHECFTEIADALDRLPPTTLLFLRNVRKIAWKIAGRSDGAIKNDISTRSHTSVATIRTRQRDSSGKSNTTHWLRFEAPIRPNARLNCSVAFLLTSPAKSEGDLESGAEKRTRGSSAQFVIAPLPDPGHLHIYFPAGKEPTGLFFHIHAPFAATVDRASIPVDHEGNRDLVGDIATLCAKSLHEIKKQGFLQPRFLGVLPNEQDKLNKFYEPIMRAIVAEFKEEPLLPTHHGQFARAKDAVSGPLELRQFFTDEDLQFLMGAPNSVWSPGFRDPSRSSSFLDTLELTAIDWQQFAEYLGGKLRPDLVSQQKIADSQRWLRERMAAAKSSTEWLRSFYLLLLRAHKNIGRWAQPDENLRNASVVWTNQDTFLPGAELFFSTGSIAVPGVPVQMIHPDLLDLDKKEAEKAKNLRAALEMLGVNEYDEGAAIVAFVRQIGSQKTISRDSHLAQMKCLLEWHRAGKIRDFKPLSSTHLFLDADEKYYWIPEMFYIDTPFSRTGIAPFFAGVPNRFALWPGYLDHFEDELFSSFAEQAGAISQIAIQHVRIDSSNPEHSRLCDGWGRVRHTDTGVNRDYWITNLDKWLIKPTHQTSLLVWQTMANAALETLTARFRPNESHKCREEPSVLVVWLKKHRWIPDRAGEFRLAADLSQDTLHPDFKYDNRNGWLDAIGFGSAAKTEEAQVLALRKAAEIIGVAPELAEELGALSSDEQKDWLDRIKASRRRGRDFPDDQSSNSQLRSRRAQEQVACAAEVEREQRPRWIRKISNRREVREYLSQKYTRDGRLFCQMSQEPVPFALPSGDPYFVAVEVLPLGKEIEANHLCLSPTCAAEFRHALLTDDNDLRARILEVVPEANQPLEVKIEVPLPEHRRVRFHPDHLTDLKSAMRVCGQ